MEIWAASTGVSIEVETHFTKNLTISMTVMFHRNTQDLEGMHSDRSALDSLLALQDHINRPSEETDKRISFRSGEEYLGQF